MTLVVLPPPPVRFRPKANVSWVTRLLAGEQQCEWALWFQWKHDVPDGPDTPERLEWRRKHDALVVQRAAELEDYGFVVGVEWDNRLACESSRTRTEIKGRPDIAIRGPDLLTYEDCKVGRRREEHHVQVLMYAILAAWQRIHQADKINGVVVYDDGFEIVDMARLGGIRDRFVALMDRVASETASRVPSYSDCRFCAVKAYCPERIERDSFEVDALPRDDERR